MACLAHIAAALLWIAAAGTTLVGCIGSEGVEMYFNYLPSDPAKLKQFLIDQNILCRGDDKATALAMVDWSRRNIVHADADEMIPTKSKSILQLLRESEAAGQVTINGCWGMADFIQQMLGAAGIRTTYDVVEIGNELHASAGLPLLKGTAIHADSLHAWKTSSRTGEIPAEEIPTPNVFTQSFETADMAIRQHESDLIKRYLPDVSMWFRIRRYGQFYTEEEIRKDRLGQVPINDVAVDRDILKMIDAEIDRLGGPDEARLILREVIDWPEFHKKLVPVSPGKFCKDGR